MNTPTFESVDFYSSAYLIAAGQRLQNAYKQGSQTVFIFDDCPEVHNLLNNYFARQAEVNASDYAQAIRNLKGVVHSSARTYSTTNAKNHERNNTR